MGKTTFAEFDTKHQALQGVPRLFVRFWAVLRTKPGGELVVNGGGEEGTLGLQATGWTLGAGNGLLVADDEKKFGARSLKIVNATAVDSHSYEDHAVKAFRTYQVEGWIKTGVLPSADAGRGAALNVDIVSGVTAFEILEKQGDDLSATAPDVGVEADDVVHDWTYVRSRYRPDADGTVRLKAQLGYSGGQSGTAWFDGMSHREIEEAAFSRDFASEAVTTPYVTKLKHLAEVSGNTQTVQPERGSSSIGTFQVRFQDDDDDMTKYCSNPRVKLGVAITPTSPANGGFVEAKAGEDIAGYPAAGTIVFPAQEKLYDEGGYDEGGYDGKLEERIRYTSRDPVTRRFSGITRAMDGTTSGYHEVDDLLHNGEEIRPGVRAQVWVGYDGLPESHFLPMPKMQVYERRLTDDGLGWEVTIADIQRSAKQQIFPSATQKKPIILFGNKVHLALKMLLTTSEGGNTKYDRGDAEGLGISESLVDVAGLELLAEQFGSQKYRIVVSGPEDGKTWLEDQWKSLNCYPMILPDGKYSAVRYAPAPAAASQPLLDDLNTIGLPRYRSGDRLIINVVEMWYDWDHVASEYMTRQVSEEEASVAKYGAQPALVIEDRGLASDLGAQEIADDRANRVFARYADPPSVLEVMGFWDHLVRDVGDIVRATFPRMPNQRKGLRGLTNEVMEITDLSPAFPFSRSSVPMVRMTLLHTGAITAPATATGIISAPVAIPTPTRYLVEAIQPRNDLLKAKYQGAVSLWVGRYKTDNGVPTSGALPVGVWSREAFSHKIVPSSGPTITF